MTSGFYKRVAEVFGIEIIVPEPIQLDYIHDKYMGELIYNRILSETRQGLVKIVKDLKKNESIQGLILGGTELPLILCQTDFSDIEIFDTTQIHVESIVAKMTED